MKASAAKPVAVVAALLITLAGAGAPARPEAGPDFHALLVKASALNRLGFFENAEAVILGAGLTPEALSQATVAASDDALARTVLARSRLGRNPDDPTASRIMADVDIAALPPALRGAVSYEKARSALASREAGEKAALDAIAGFIDEYPGADDEFDARLLYADELILDGYPAAAARQVAVVAASHPGRSREARARLVVALSATEPERSRLMRRLFIEMPESRAADATGLRAGDLSNAELRERADAFFKTWDFVQYQETLQLLRARGDDSPGLAWELAVSHLVHVRDKPDEALALMLSARARGVGTGPDGTFMLGRAYAKVEDYANAEKCFADYLKTGARDRRMLAHYYLAWLPYDHGEYVRALPAMNRFLKLYRKSDRYSYMIWFKGWALFRMGRYRDALSVFASMKKLGNCLVAGKAMYWGGVAWHRLGDRGQARKWMREVIDRYPLTWYSILAAKRLKEWHGEPLPGWMTAPAALPSGPEPLWGVDSMPADVAAGIRDVRMLAGLGEPRLARKAYAKVSARAEKGLRGADLARFLVTVADATENYSALMKKSGAFSSRMGRTPSPSSGVFWAARYPRAYRPLASAAAGRHGIPELWVYSIMRQESRYDSTQVSHTAALGLMQMIVATAHIVGGQVGVRWEPDSFFEPGVNILFGTKYLSDLHRDFKGQIVFASAAYNTGAPAIKRFMATHRGLPLDEMVEMIPYNEGRNYCRKVAEHLARYGAIYLEPEERSRLYDTIFPDKVDYDLGDLVNY